MRLLLVLVQEVAWRHMFWHNAGLKVCLIEAGPMYDPQTFHPVKKSMGISAAGRQHKIQAIR